MVEEGLGRNAVFVAAFVESCIFMGDIRCASMDLAGRLREKIWMALLISKYIYS